MSNPEAIRHPVVISQVIVNFAATLGVDIGTCLLGTDIAEDQLQGSDALVSRAQEMRLIENLILALPDEPALGFRLGLQYTISTFGAWGFALRTSRTLREAATVALRYLPLSTAYCRIKQFDEHGSFGVVLDPGTIPGTLRQFLLERDMATGINLINELGLKNIALSGVEFQGAPLDYAVHIEALCGVKPVYHSSRNAITVTIEEANRLLPTYDSQLVRLMDEQCRHQLQRRIQIGVTGQVRQQILGPLGLRASIEEVSEALSMSPRSLRRKLDSESTSFRLILDQERQQIALQLLQGSDMKLEELAFHLGYTDTASFYRAFRRWMGCSPGEYRKSLQPGD